MSGLYSTFVKEPLFNLIQLLYNLTGDTGWSIVLVAVIINLALFPLFAKSFINGQKTRLLQPDLKKIQKKYKDNPQVMYAKTREFYKKHGIKNGATFLTLIVQILLLLGLYTIIKNIVNGDVDKLPELYSWVNGEQFNHTAFGFLDIRKLPKEYKYILPVITAVLAYFQGMFTFKWGPKKKIDAIVDSRKDKKKEEGIAGQLQKSMQFQSLYILPIFFFFINVSLITGVNIYFLTSTSIGVIRQIALSLYYSSHIDKLLEEVADSDPTSRDKNTSNNIDMTADPSQITSRPNITKVIDVKAKKKTTSKSKSKNKKGNKKGMKKKK